MPLADTIDRDRAAIVADNEPIPPEVTTALLLVVIVAAIAAVPAAVSFPEAGPDTVARVPVPAIAVVDLARALTVGASAPDPDMVTTAKNCPVNGGICPSAKRPTVSKPRRDIPSHSSRYAESVLTGHVECMGRGPITTLVGRENVKP